MIFIIFRTNSNEFWGFHQGPSAGACHLLVLHLVLPLPLVMSITLRETEGVCAEKKKNIPNDFEKYMIIFNCLL